jgi:hypothetical protein
MLKGLYIEGNVPRAHPKMSVDYPPYYNAEPYVITSWYEYETIIEYYSGIIVVNTHGQYLPVPSDQNRENWTDTIADAMLHRRLTWVHVGNYTFYRVWYQSSGDGGEWTETVGGRVVGAGFRRLVSHINKPNANLWPPSGSENSMSTFAVPTDQQMALSWYSKDGSIMDYHYAAVGRPLKKSDFGEYLIMPIYAWMDPQTNEWYYPGAVIAFANASDRYNSGGGAGAYVHMGTCCLKSIGTPPVNYDADFGRGFVGTAAALFVESMGFSATVDSKQLPNTHLINSSIIVCPLVSGFRDYGDNVSVLLRFVVHGLLEEEHGVPGYIDNFYFYLENATNEWPNVRMKADLDVSVDGNGGALQISGLYKEGSPLFKFVPSALIWGVSPFVPSSSVAGLILKATGGLMLFSNWYDIVSNADPQRHGIDGWDNWIEFRYNARMNINHKGNNDYYQSTSIIAVELSLPKRTGWQILPIYYDITAILGQVPADMDYPDSEGTVNIAIWTGPNGGQNDAGSGGDASDNQAGATSVTFSGNYHAYIGGDDTQDWFSFYVTSPVPPSTPLVWVEMTPPPFVDFDLVVVAPSGHTYGSHNGPGVAEMWSSDPEHGHEIGLWKIEIYGVSSSGVYSFHIYWGAGGDDPCPTLFVYNGTGYVDYGVINIHNPTGEDAVREVSVSREDVAIVNHQAYLRLREGWPGLNFSESVIDQVKLCAVVCGNRLPCPLIYANHSRLGNVLPSLLFSDDRKAQILLLETIDLRFLMPYPITWVQSYVFVIEGCNQLKG